MMVGATAPSVIAADETAPARRSRMTAALTTEMAWARRNAILTNVPRWDFVIAGKEMSTSNSSACMTVLRTPV